VKYENLKIDPGDEPAIIADGNRQPDRRQISARWLIGACLTGLTSCSLMGVALFAALDGREQLAEPPELLRLNDMPTKPTASGDTKGDRLVLTRPRRSFVDRKHFDLPTLHRVGEHEIIRTQGFELVTMALAKEPEQNFDYPAFNALNLFNETPIEEGITDTASLLLGETIETDISLTMREFPEEGLIFDEADRLSDEAAEYTARQAAQPQLNENSPAHALAYISAAQMAPHDAQNFGFSDAPDVKIVQENVSIVHASLNGHFRHDYSEDLIPLSGDEPTLEFLNRLGYTGRNATRVAESLQLLMNTKILKAGSMLRLGVETSRFGEDFIVRASLYEGTTHRLSIALNDDNNFVRTNEPEVTPLLQAAIAGGTPIIRVATAKLPSVYDAVFRSALSYGMTQEMAGQLVRMLANDIDMQESISPADSIDVLYPLKDADNDADANSPTEHEILYVAATFDGKTRRYYRFRSPDGGIDYYDAEGRSSKQFLLRKPVPNGLFRSPFGPRKHPILGYTRMHTGVDWSAPRGAPIIAAGDGEVVEAGWRRGYGNHTAIRHANGYVTSYSHQSAFASGIRPGVKVRQGQVIGYVGSTGLSTGPHCHFEVLVNGTQVDPMRIRLPDNKSLSGEALAAFERDRANIDTLMDEGNKVISVVSM